MLFDSRLDPHGVIKLRQRKLMNLNGLTNMNFRRQCQRTKVMDNSEAEMTPSRFRRTTLVQLQDFQEGVAWVTQVFSGSSGSSNGESYDFVGKCRGI